MDGYRNIFECFDDWKRMRNDDPSVRILIHHARTFFRKINSRVMMVFEQRFFETNPTNINIPTFDLSWSLRLCVPLTRDISLMRMRHYWKRSEQWYAH